MRKHLTTLAGAALLLAFGFTSFPTGARATTVVVINNGLATPNPANVIDASNSFLSGQVFVQNVGCDATVQIICPAPGAPTTVEIVDGGQGADGVEVFESSTLIVSGGLVGFGSVLLRQSSTILISGGFLREDINVQDSASAFMSGGSIDNLFVFESGTAVVSGGTLRIGQPVDAGILAVNEFATLTVRGSGFAVDGSLVPYGPLVATSGTLSGVLASGDLINNPFIRDAATAQIVLALPEPTTALLLACGLVGLGAAHRRRVG